MGAHIPLAAPNTHCGIEGGYGERTTTAHATAFEGSRVRGFGGSRFESRASPRRDHRPWGSGDEQVLVTRSDVGQKGQIKLGEEAARMPNVALSMREASLHVGGVIWTRGAG